MSVAMRRAKREDRRRKPQKPVEAKDKLKKEEIYEKRYRYQRHFRWEIIYSG